MSGYTGGQTELLYAMPASAAAVTAAAATVMSGTTAANPPYALPLDYFWQKSGGGAGKSLMIKGGGWWATPTATRTTNFQIGLNSTAGTGTILLPFGKTGTLTTVVTTNAIGTIGTYSSNNASRFLIGTPQTPVAPVPSTQYFIECSNTWDATTNAPTITLTNFLIFGLN